MQAHGRDKDPETLEIFQKHRKTHNGGVSACYTDEIRKARSACILTGLRDGYGRGRIIGDYRRVALYGVDRLIADKMKQVQDNNNANLTEEWVREREETQDQIKALKDLKTMATAYGFDISLLMKI